MWFLKPKKDVWHFYESPGPRVGLCGATAADSPDILEQERKPAGFNGLLCNRCWFQHEVAKVSNGIEDEDTREWLGALDFGAISESDRERLYCELGEDRADSLAVIHSLAESSEPDLELELVVPPVETVKECFAELVAIPLAVRVPVAPIEPEHEELDSAAIAAAAEPRIKVNYARRTPEGNGSSGIGRLLKRITERA